MLASIFCPVALRGRVVELECCVESVKEALSMNVSHQIKYIGISSTPICDIFDAPQLLSTSVKNLVEGNLPHPQLEKTTVFLGTVERVVELSISAGQRTSPFPTFLSPMNTETKEMKVGVGKVLE